MTHARYHVRHCVALTAETPTRFRASSHEGVKARRVQLSIPRHGTADCQYTGWLAGRVSLSYALIHRGNKASRPRAVTRRSDRPHVSVVFIDRWIQGVSELRVLSLDRRAPAVMGGIFENSLAIFREESNWPSSRSF